MSIKLAIILQEDSSQHTGQKWILSELIFLEKKKKANKKRTQLIYQLSEQNVASDVKKLQNYQGKRAI